MKKTLTRILSLVLIISALMGITTIGASAAAGNGTAYASTQSVLLDGKPVEFQCYALKDAKGNPTNYIKLRDLALMLNGTDSQFEVGWNGKVTITTGQPYTANGSELKTPFSGNRAYTKVTNDTIINGTPVNLDAFMLYSNSGGGFTYYKLRDLGNAIGFEVDWQSGVGIIVNTAKTETEPVEEPEIETDLSPVTIDQYLGHRDAYRPSIDPKQTVAYMKKNNSPLVYYDGFKDYFVTQPNSDHPYQGVSAQTYYGHIANGISETSNKFIAVASKAYLPVLSVDSCPIELYDMNVVIEKDVYTSILGDTPIENITKDSIYYTEGMKGIIYKFEQGFDDNAFAGVKFIKNLVIDQADYIGKNAWSNTGLETVIIGANDHWYLSKEGGGRTTVRDENNSPVLVACTDNRGTANGLLYGHEAIVIESGAFSNNPNLTSFIAMSEPARLYIAPGAFTNCPKLTVYGPAGGQLEAYCKANGIKFRVVTNATLESSDASHLNPWLEEAHKYVNYSANQSYPWATTDRSSWFIYRDMNGAQETYIRRDDEYVARYKAWALTGDFGIYAASKYVTLIQDTNNVDIVPGYPISQKLADDTSEKLAAEQRTYDLLDSNDLLHQLVGK